MTPTRFTLRQLPLAAKFVLTVFLTAVGLGYFSALVQLHMKHSGREGEALPTLDDVVERFAGLKKPDDCPPVSRVEALVGGNPDEPDVGKENMAPAFFAKSKGWADLLQARGRRDPGRPTFLWEERETERQALLDWVRKPADEKKRSYEADNYPLPDGLKGRLLTPEFKTAEGVKIKSLIDARCQTCHKDQAPSLGSYAELAPFVCPPTQELIDGKWVRSPKQMSTEALTQSTHAHLLSFAVLFTLTGLVFAFTGYPAVIRGVVAPVVLLAQVADVSFWWLARLPGYGPYFAQGIVVTGGIVGTGLMLQIVLGLFDLYGRTGKAVLVLLFLAGGGALGLVGVKVIKPALDAEREAKAQAAQAPPRPETKTNGEPTVRNVNGQQQAPPVSDLERLIMGPIEGAPLNRKGSMAAAFFHKDGADYKQLIKERPKAEVDAEREGERQAVRAWIRADPATRKKAYQDNKFTLPPELAGKPISGDYLDENKAVRVKAILYDRCERCHSKGGDQPDFPLETYEQLAKYIDGK